MWFNVCYVIITQTIFWMKFCIDSREGTFGFRINVCLICDNFIAGKIFSWRETLHLLTRRQCWSSKILSILHDRSYLLYGMENGHDFIRSTLARRDNRCRVSFQEKMFPEIKYIKQISTRKPNAFNTRCNNLYIFN